MEVKLIFNNLTKIINANIEDNVLDILLINGAKLQTACGGRGRCNKCKVKLIDGTVKCNEIDENGDFLSCLATFNGPCTIKLNCDCEVKEKNTRYNVAINNGNFGIAFDLGTTTLAFSLVDLDIKETVETFSALNKQAKFGADVISRISSSNEGHLLELHKIIISELNDAIAYFKNKYNITKISKVVVSGNTTMLHLFNNTSPKTIGVAPFTPVFLESKEITGSKLMVDADTIVLLPSMSSFIGADITAGVYSSSLPNNSILIDLGTNGEIICKLEDKYYSCSTACGPCLEGAEIECGIGGVPGAISKFETLNGKYVVSTIDNAKITGICGAGLVDIIATLLRDEIIDESGSLNLDSGRFEIQDSVYLSQQDVRKFQLAKSAIYSGLYALLDSQGKTFEDLDHYYLAGGIGYYISIPNAIKCGLLPECAKDKITVLGNSSLKGAIRALLDPSAIDTMQAIANNTSLIDLNKSSAFSYGYVENMFFI